MAANAGTHPARVSRRAAHLLVAVTSLTCLSGCQKGTAPDAPATIARLLQLDALQTPPGGVLLDKVINPGGGFGFGESVASVELVYAVTGTVTTVGDYYQKHFARDVFSVHDDLSYCSLPTCENILGSPPSPDPNAPDAYDITISADAPNFTQVGSFSATLPPTPPGHATYVVIEASGGSAG